MAEFLHIYITPKKDVTRDKVEEKLNAAVDWFRYYGNVYVVYTTADVNTWKNRLIDLVKPDGSMFICKLDIKNRNGWMSKDFWNWIKSKKEAV